MCQKIVINLGEKEIETPREFQEHFGFLPQTNEHYGDLNLDACLCQCDLEQSFKSNNIPFKMDELHYDYLVSWPIASENQ